MCRLATSWYDESVDADQLTTVTDEDEDEDDLDADEPVEALPQVSSYIAIIRIVAVLGMGLCLSFGLFISLVGIRGIIIGIPIMLLSIPCYYGMQLAERLANREQRKRDASLET